MKSILFIAAALVLAFPAALHAADCQGQQTLCGGNFIPNADSCSLDGSGNWYGYCSQETQPPGCQGEQTLCGGDFIPNADSCGLTGDGHWYGYCSK